MNFSMTFQFIEMHLYLQNKKIKNLFWQRQLSFYHGDFLQTFTAEYMLTNENCIIQGHTRVSVVHVALENVQLFTKLFCMICMQSL